jgi:hypothetical protein
MRAHLIATPLALAALFAASPALADPANHRSVAGAACVPSDTTLANLGGYQVMNGGIEFAAPATGTVTFFCPVPLAVNSGGYYAWLGVDNDDDGVSTSDYYVKADFLRRSGSTGAAETLCTVYSRSPSVASQQCVDPSGTPILLPIDRVGYVYFARVTLFRRAVQPDGQSIRFLGIGFTQ